MLDTIEQYIKRMKWRKPLEVTDMGYELSRLKHDLFDCIARVEDMEKHYSSTSSSKAGDDGTV